MNNINAKELRDILVSGANNLANNYKIIDALNVFPIPDGDTGTNMTMTIKSGVKNIAAMEPVSCGDLAGSFSKGLLFGARGNSGVILSQIFRGFAEGAKGIETLSVADVARAFVCGTERAYKAVLKPVEGTMLTVIREASNAVKAFIDSTDASLEQVFAVMVTRAKEALDNTPNLLPVLKEAGVVDSGGAGVLKILEGFYEASKGNVVLPEDEVKKEEKKAAKEEAAATVVYKDHVELTIALDVAKESYSKIKFEAFLRNNGGQVVTSRDGDKVSVEVNTDDPAAVYTFASKYGNVITFTSKNIAASEEEAKANENRKKQAIVAVAFGNGLTDIFKQMRADIVISGGQTMNPSIDDFVKAITKLNPESVIILPNNSNIIMAAKQAAEVLNNQGIVTKIVPTTSIQQGISACMGFNPECDIEENLIEMFAATKRVTCGQITTAVRDSKLNGVAIKCGDYLGIKEKKIISSSKDIYKVATNLIDNMMTYDAEIVTIIAGADATKKTVGSLEKYISEKYTHVEVEVRQGDQPVYYLLLAVE